MGVEHWNMCPGTLGGTARGCTCQSVSQSEKKHSEGLTMIQQFFAQLEGERQLGSGARGQGAGVTREKSLSFLRILT